MNSFDDLNQPSLNDNYQKEIEILEEEIVRLNIELEEMQHRSELFAAKILKIIEIVAVPGTVIDDQGKLIIRVARQSTGNLGYFNHEVPFYSDIYFEELKNGHIALHKKVDEEYADQEDRIQCTVCGSMDGQIIQDLYKIKNGVIYRTDSVEEHAICENCYSDLMFN